MRPLIRRALCALVVCPLTVGMSSTAMAEPDGDGSLSYSFPDAPPSGTAATGSSGQAAAPVIARAGALTSRPPGMPQSGMRARQLRSATVRQSRTGSGRVTGTFELRKRPTTATVAHLHVQLGTMSGSECVGKVGVVTRTGKMAPGFRRSGATITLDKVIDGAKYLDFNCAFAALTKVGDRDRVYDVLIGRLWKVYAKPRLAMPHVRFLQRDVTRVGAVRNAWTKLDVTVKNTGAAAARAVVVRGSGNGLEVTTARLGAIAAGDSETAVVQVRLLASGQRSLRLAARGTGVSVARTLTVVPVAPPARPAAGTYRGHDGRVRFSIRNGRVTGWRAFVMTTCGAYPDIPTTTFNWYDFPTRWIPRNGIVDSRVRAELYTIELEMRVSGTRVTRGHFTYRGPNWCRGSISFNAHRVGN